MTNDDIEDLSARTTNPIIQKLCRVALEGDDGDEGLAQVHEILALILEPLFAVAALRDGSEVTIRGATVHDVWRRFPDDSDQRVRVFDARSVG